MKNKVLGALCAISLAASGCGEEKVKASDVATVASTNTASIVRGTGGAAQVVNQLSAITTMVDGLNSVTKSFESVPVSNELPCDSCSGSGSGSGGSSDVAAPSAPPENDFNAQADRIEKYLAERIFTEENLEESDSDAATFKLDGDDVCTDGSTPADPACVEQVNKLELRIRATPFEKTGVDLTFILGPNKFEPFTLVIRENALAVQVDLGQTKSTVEYFAAQNGQTTDLPRVLEGVVELRLTKNGEKDITFSTAILAAVNVEVDGSSGLIQFSTAAKSPLSSLRLQGIEKKATFEADLGTTTFSQPYSEVNASGTAGNRVTYSLSGLSYKFEAQEGQQAITVAHVGLGDAKSSFSIDGRELYAVDLNQLSGRHFDVTVQKDTDGMPIVAVAPEFDLIQKFALGALKADQFVAPHLEDETYRVRLTGGAGNSSSLKPVDRVVGGFPGGLKVVSGTLTLETNKPGVPTITVPEGQCLTSKSLEDGGHALLGHLTAQACP